MPPAPPLKGQHPELTGRFRATRKVRPAAPLLEAATNRSPIAIRILIGGKGTTAVTGTVTKTGFRQWARRSIKAVVALGPKDPALLRRAGFIEEEIMKI